MTAGQDLQAAYSAVDGKFDEMRAQMIEMGWSFPMQCDKCGGIMSSEDAGFSTKLEWGGTRYEPAVYIQICPECGAEDSFQESDDG